MGTCHNHVAARLIFAVIFNCIMTFLSPRLALCAANFQTLEGGVRDSNRPAINRRNAIGLLAVTPVIASPFGADAWTGVSGLRTDAAQLGQGPTGMTPDLAKLTAEHFEPLVGKTFTVGEHRLTLKNVRRGPRTSSRFRRQFALVFNAPRNESIGSKQLPVSHPAIGRHDLLVGQVGPGPNGSAVEICFA
jgi:hypothetical protein